MLKQVKLTKKSINEMMKKHGYKMSQFDDFLIDYKIQEIYDFNTGKTIYFQIQGFSFKIESKR